jgi:hypothetical protein
MVGERERERGEETKDIDIIFNLKWVSSMSKKIDKSKNQKQNNWKNWNVKKFD